MNLLKNKLQILITIIFLGFVVWQVTFQSVVDKQGLSVQWFGGTYGVIALIGSIIGFTAAQKWGGFKTTLGKALMFFSIGLLAQEAGQIIGTYYAYGLKEGLPYPSWADVAYFGSALCYLGGAIILTKVAGAKYSLKDARYKTIAILVPIIILAISSWIFLYHHQFDTSKPLTVVLDLGYPIVQALYISFGLTAFLLSTKILGGVMRSGILILIAALVAQYASDFTFLYQSSRGGYVPGKFDDLFYLIAYFIMTTAMIKFLATYTGLRNKTRGPTPTAGANAQGIGV